MSDGQKALMVSDSPDPQVEPQAKRRIFTRPCRRFRILVVQNAEVLGLTIPDRLGSIQAACRFCQDFFPLVQTTLLAKAGQEENS